MVSELEVYQKLSAHTWKTAREVMIEINKDKTGEEHPLRSVSYADIYAHIQTFELNGYVQSRERNLTKDALRLRSNNPSTEYKLTATGIQRRHEVEGRRNPPTELGTSYASSM